MDDGVAGAAGAGVAAGCHSRAVLAELLARTCGVDAAADAARFAACCVLVDKLEKVPPEALHGDFGALGVAAADVDALAAVLRDAADAGGSLAALEALIGDGPALSNLRALVDLAEAGGFGDWIVVDASVVRGLAYYTGVVFEAFDRQGALRAIAGGGRYDRLLETFGGDPLPAVGFGFGDAVIMELVKDKGLLPESLKSGNVDDLVYPMNAALRPAAMGIAARLRATGRCVDLVIEDGKKPKWAFKHAERCGASRVVLIGEKEWEQGVVRVKDLATREETDVKPEDLC